MTCPYCHRRSWPLWSILVLILLLFAKDAAQTGFAFVAGRWYERGGLTQAWKGLANDMVNRDIQRQLGEKEKRK